MGYITSASTQYLDLHITEKGRKFLLQGSLGDQIVKFALGDGDKDYMNSQNLPSGYVPDVTGSHNNCIFGVSDGYTIKDKITYLPGGLNVLAKQAQSQIVFGYKSLGNTVWANQAAVTVHLADYLSLFKVLALQNSPYHSFNNINMKTTFASYFNKIFDSAGEAWGVNMDVFYNTLEEMGKGLDLKIIHNIFKNEGGAFVPTQVKLTLVGNNSNLLFKSLFGAVYINESGQPVTGNGPILGKKKIPSPFCLTNSIFTDNQNKVWAGAGPLGINLGAAFSYGYMVGRLIANVPFYPEYAFEDKAGGVYDMYDAQNSKLNKSLFNTVEGADLNTIIPTITYLRPDNTETNQYSILQTNQLNIDKNAAFTSESGPAFEGRAGTSSTADLDTFGFFAAGTPQYEKVKWGKGFSNKFRKMQPNTALEPYMLITTLVQDIIKFFDIFSKDPTVGQLVQVTGSNPDNTDKVFTIPLTLQASDATNSNVKSGHITINFVLSVPAILHNFTRDAATANSAIRYRALDTSQDVARFYGGAALDGFTEFTTDPTHFTTSGGTGYKTFVEFNSL